MYVLMLSLKTRKKIPARKLDYYTRMLAIINSKPIERILPLKGGGGRRRVRLGGYKKEYEKVPEMKTFPSS